MLTSEVKQRIDSARDVLVGKVPDPKTQIEQITNALIYKFMDDMDKESMSLPKGKAQFFTNGYEKYAWTKLMDPRLSGQDRMNLYDEALKKMSQNPHLPQLFRDIFKDAFLPFRDPETLNLFLKEINGFIYDHSENLGDAFEYLLSVMGSQGGAGQFRTPRHIIDFIVEVVDPKKDESVLDPACGTSGFLIAAYKHIQRINKEKPLTPDEKTKLMGNLAGYDISPDMVKISRVNMYLHGFQDPRIYEYDTLSSEEKWDERFDVMMANPPFMTPKGGIRPHKRFMVQVNRAEVLFVDYILEHLNTKGRAGIIVPEGIIFQSSNVYKQLRKHLVEDGLYAVVSLPSGVFNPYAGVKTSILFFDNDLVKRTKNILFVTVLNDGFDLGAQRRPIEGNQLPDAASVIKAFHQNPNITEKELENVAAKEAFKQRGSLKKLYEEISDPILVSKEKIAESGDYNLTGGRYEEVETNKNQKWPIVALGDVCKISSGDSAPQSDEAFENGETPFVRMKDLGRYHLTTNLVETDDFINKNFVQQKGITVWPRGSVLIPKSGSVYLNHRAILGIDAAVVGHIAVLSDFIPSILNSYLYYVLKLIDIGKMASRTSGLDAISLTLLRQVKIPLPPLEVQKEIVEWIEVKQNIIEHAKEIIKNLESERRYFGQSLRKLNFDSVEVVQLMDIISGFAFDSEKFNEANGMPIIRIRNIKIGRTTTKYDGEYAEKYVVHDGDLLVGMDGEFNATIWQGGDALLNQRVCKLFNFKGVLKEFVSLAIQDYLSEIEEKTYAVTVKHISVKQIEKIKIPLPPLEIQKQLVDEAKNEEEIIATNHRLIELMEVKIKEVLKAI